MPIFKNTNKIDKLLGKTNLWRKKTCHEWKNFTTDPTDTRSYSWTHQKSKKKKKKIS